MSDRSILLFVVGIVVIVIPLSLGLTLWFLVRLRRKSDQPLSQETDGVVTVPVRRLARAFFPFGHTENSLSARFEITRTGLRFKVFKTDYWPFEDIQRVDVPRALFATRIAFRGQKRRTLFVDVADQAKGRALLKALPSNLPFTPRAVALRDGGV